MTDLPLFVYGTLRPHELAFGLLADLVGEHRPAVLDHYQLSVRDGLPLAVPAKGRAVQGDLLLAKEGLADALRARAADYEPTDLYSCQTVTVDGVVCLAFLGKSAGKGSPQQQGPAWESCRDPLFSGALPAIRRSMLRHLVAVEPRPADMQGYWDDVLVLQGNYLTLCTVLERLALFRYGGVGGSINQRLQNLCRESAAVRALAYANPPAFTVVSAATLGSAIKVPGDRSFLAWYQVRSNLSHQGKSGLKDFDLLERSTIGALLSFPWVLAEHLNEQHAVPA